MLCDHDTLLLSAQLSIYTEAYVRSASVAVNDAKISLLSFTVINFVSESHIIK